MKWSHLGLGAIAAVLAGAGLTVGVMHFTGTAQADSPGGAASRLQEILAQKLGVSVDTLTKAETDTKNQYADELAAAGTITQAQADKIKAAGVGNILGGIARFGAREGVREARVEVNIAQITASVSKIDNATLKSELGQGKSFATIAGEHGVSRDALKSAITSAEKTQLDAAVGKGTLTQVQADQAAQRLAANLDSLIDRTGPAGAGFGHHKGPMMPKSPTP
jgi:hypothetical protein